MIRESYGVRDIPDYYLQFSNGEIFHFECLKSARTTLSKGSICLYFEDALLLEGIEDAILSSSLIKVKREQYFRTFSNGEDVLLSYEFPQGEWDITMDYGSDCTGDPQSINYVLTFVKN